MVDKAEQIAAVRAALGGATFTPAQTEALMGAFTALIDPDAHEANQVVPPQDHPIEDPVEAAKANAASYVPPEEGPDDGPSAVDYDENPQAEETTEPGEGLPPAEAPTEEVSGNLAF